MSDFYRQKCASQLNSIESIIVETFFFFKSELRKNSINVHIYEPRVESFIEPEDLKRYATVTKSTLDLVMHLELLYISGCTQYIDLYFTFFHFHNVGYFIRKKP